MAVSAALAAAPVLPRGVAAADSPGSGPATAGTTDVPGNGTLRASSERIVLEYGSQGELVAAVQRRLNEVLPLTHLAVDGIYGPLTRRAILDFQHRQGLAETGSLDVRAWAVLFKAPVMVLGQAASAGSGSANGSTPTAGADGSGSVDGSAGGNGRFVSLHTSGSSGSQAPAATEQANGGGQGASSAPAPRVGTGGPGGGAATTGQGSGSTSVAVVAPSSPSSQPSTYVLTDGVALPLPRGYVTGGYVDQGVDYAAPGGTPLYAMGDGVIIGEGISGFGPNAPILQITSGPLKGLEVYYGHAGANSVHVGQRVRAGQQISEVGYGIVGISTGPHLEIGFYPPGPMGSGSRMLSLINSLLRQHRSGRVWGASASVARAGAAGRQTTAPSAHVARASVTPASALATSTGGATVAASSATSTGTSTGSSQWTGSASSDTVATQSSTASTPASGSPDSTVSTPTSGSPDPTASAPPPGSPEPPTSATTSTDSSSNTDGAGTSTTPTPAPASTDPAPTPTPASTDPTTPTTQQSPPGSDQTAVPSDAQAQPVTSDITQTSASTSAQTNPSTQTDPSTSTDTQTTQSSMDIQTATTTP